MILEKKPKQPQMLLYIPDYIESQASITGLS